MFTDKLRELIKLFISTGVAQIPASKKFLKLDFLISFQSKLRCDLSYFLAHLRTLNLLHCQVHYGLKVKVMKKHVLCISVIIHYYYNT